MHIYFSGYVPVQQKESEAQFNVKVAIKGTK